MSDWTDVRDGVSYALSERFPLLSDFTLRDYFAVMALHGCQQNGDRERWSYADIAYECYTIADAMLAERAK